jgi:hypothetical protein
MSDGKTNASKSTCLKWDYAIWPNHFCVCLLKFSYLILKSKTQVNNYRVVNFFYTYTSSRERERSTTFPLPECCP